MSPMARYMLGSAALLTLFALAGTVPVAGLHSATAEKIAQNLQLTRLRSINEVLPADQYDNDILASPQTIVDEQLIPGGKTATVYIARRQDDYVASIFETTAPDGYSGNILMLVGVLKDGSISGVRILEHRETPGLGDAIDQYHSDYLDVFPGKSLKQPRAQRWAVKRDGGDFDQLTGATITPRAVVAAIKRVLVYYNTHAERLIGESENNPTQNNGN